MTKKRGRAAQRTAGTATEPESFKYDVAISFLWQDERLARELKEQLEPGLRVYVASREAESTLGRDGLELFRNVFRRESRLAVILYRDGWGESKFTAVEEAGIKDRAYTTNLTSYMLVKLDDAPIRDWMPEQHIYTYLADYTTAQLVGAIRLKATEVGAVVRRESPAEAALRQGRLARRKQEREERFRSFGAVAEVKEELSRIYALIESEVREVVEGSEEDPGVRCSVQHQTFVISGPVVSMSLRFRQRASNHIQEAFLEIVEWDGAATIQPGGNVAGHRFHGSSAYQVALSEGDEWIWIERSDLERPSSSLIHISLDSLSGQELVALVIRRYFARLFDGE